MDGRRLKLPSLTAVTERFDKYRSLWPVVLLFILAIAGLILLWWASPYYDDLYTLLPGFYENSEYDEVTSVKNDLIEENALLLDDIDELEVTLDDVEVSADGYVRKAEINSEIIAVQETIRENLVEILALDEQLLAMRLPDVVTQYIRISYDLDLIRMDLIELNLDISNARRDLAELNKLRSDFDSCLAGVNWSEADSKIADSVDECAGKVPDIEEKVAMMESRYEVELTDLKRYLRLLREEWEANASYYRAISEGDYSKANEHDQVFVDRKRKISKINVAQVFNEFYEIGLGPMMEEFIELSEEEAVYNERAEQWYQTNLLRAE